MSSVDESIFPNWNVTIYNKSDAYNKDNISKWCYNNIWCCAHGKNDFAERYKILAGYGLEM